jgi:hypothetical protein
MGLRIDDGFPVVQESSAIGLRAEPLPAYTVPLYAQQSPLWCWAACTQMLGDATGYNARLQQCVLAQTYVQGAKNCCSNPRPDNCDGWASGDKIQQIYSDIQIGMQPVPNNGCPVGEAEFLQLLSTGPVQVYWTSRDQTMAHVAIVVGARQTAHGEMYTVNDPWPLPSAGLPGGTIGTFAFEDMTPAIASGNEWDWSYYWHR